MALKDYNPMQYRGGNQAGNKGTMSPQWAEFYMFKKALKDTEDEKFFQQLASTRSMPRHMGREFKQPVYYPLLDERNINDQGIDANGATYELDKFYVTLPSETTEDLGTSDATAITDALTALGLTGGGTDYNTEGSNPALKVVITARDIIVDESDENLILDLAEALEAGFIGATGLKVRKGSGNLYGSSRDVASVQDALPVMREQGGRINRVGYKRDIITARLQSFGFFDDYTRESVVFDSDAELRLHITREALIGANKINEDVIQATLLNEAGVRRYPGSNARNDQLTAEVNANDVVTYTDLVKLRMKLDKNKCPIATKMITGTSLIDTVTVPKARYLYVAREVLPMLEVMKDGLQQPAWKPVETYAAGTTVAKGEVGSIAGFRVISPLTMLYYNEGAIVEDNHGDCYSGTGVDGLERYTVFPMLVVGSESFTHVGFETGGKAVKFKIIHKPPAEERAYRDDPYGEIGFFSIRWYQAVLVMRPEWIAVYHTLATM